MNRSFLPRLGPILLTIWPALAGAAGPGVFGGMPDDNFGSSVAMSGDTAVVGVPAFDVNAGGQIRENQGAVFVYVRDGGQWREQARLVAADGGAQDGFGTSVAVSADTILVGAPQQGTGAAYLFTRTANAWTQGPKLHGSGVFAVASQFGNAVALQGDVAIVAAVNDVVGAVGSAGSAHVFVRGSGDWPQQARLVASDPALAAQFGRSVAISGDTVLIGAARVSAAYVFVRSGSSWNPQQRLSPAAGDVSELFGASVALSGDTALIGAPLFDASATLVDSGAAYVYTRTGSTWSQEARLIASDTDRWDLFGTVALQGDSALVGAPFKLAGGSRAGAVYAFSRSGSQWTENALLHGRPSVDAVAEVGGAVALSGNTAVIGARQDEVDGEHGRGSVHLCIGSGAHWSLQQRLTTDTGAGDPDALLKDGFEAC